MLDLIINGHLSGEESEKLAQEMKTYVRKSKKSIDDLIIWLKSQNDILIINHSELDICQFIDQLTAYHKELAVNKQVELIHTCEDNLILNTDKDILTIILNNLISNAIKFTPAKGIVTLDASRTNEFVELRIKDTGEGFDPDNSNLSYQKHSNGNGSGLGLVISKELVQKLDGKMEINSTIGKGTEVTLTFPC